MVEASPPTFHWGIHMVWSTYKHLDHFCLIINAKKHPYHFSNIVAIGAFSGNYLKEICWSQPKPHLSSKYFLRLIRKSFSKVSQVLTATVKETSMLIVNIQGKLKSVDFWKKLHNTQQFWRNHKDVFQIFSVLDSKINFKGITAPDSYGQGNLQAYHS